MLAFLLAVIIDTAAPEPATATPPHNYLKPAGDRCDTSAVRDEIVVCGNKDANERFRLHPVENDPRYAEVPVRAQVKLGNGTLALHNEDGTLGGGQHSKRAMVTFTLPF